MNYKVKNATGPWTAGQIITDKDIEGWPGGGGVKRLRDKLGAIENTTEKPGGQTGDNASLVEHASGTTPPAELTSGNPLGVKETPEDRVRKNAGDVSGDAPNARGQRPAGKS